MVEPRRRIPVITGKTLARQDDVTVIKRYGAGRGRVGEITERTKIADRGHKKNPSKFSIGQLAMKGRPRVEFAAYRGRRYPIVFPTCAKMADAELNELLACYLLMKSISMDFSPRSGHSLGTIPKRIRVPVEVRNIAMARLQRYQQWSDRGIKEVRW